MTSLAPQPAAVMRDMITAGHRARMIQVAARLRLPDLIAGHRPTTTRLAALTGADAAALGRLLRALAASDVFAVNADGSWELTVLGETLRSGAPSACHAAAIYWGLDSIRGAWDRLEHSVRTGVSRGQREGVLRPYAQRNGR
jgi:hypothetical protein